MFYPQKLPKWEKRSLEVRYFHNPLVILNLIINLIAIYKEEHKQGVPLPVIFCIIPFFLQEDLYNALPRSKATLFTTWIYQDKKIIKHIFLQRYKNIYPYIQEALLLGFTQKLIYINESFIDSSNKENDEKLKTKMKILSLWFSPELYIKNMSTIGVNYELSN